ncbi:MAG: hypothetical protein RLO51_11170 [Thalassobaculum sp.]|uniref:hypothetical protein n=1 Tax=Thalassobaculum sp. TaxID=2022740 RepID=UPI0032EEE2A3
MSTVQLSAATVEIVEKITWGQKEQIQQAMLSGLKVAGGGQAVDFDPEAISRAKYKAIEVCVLKITEGDKEVPYSREWLDNLSVEDGDALYAAIDAVTNPAKK